MTPAREASCRLLSNLVSNPSRSRPGVAARRQSHLSLLQPRSPGPRARLLMPSSCYTNYHSSPSTPGPWARREIAPPTPASPSHSPPPHPYIVPLHFLSWVASASEGPVDASPGRQAPRCRGKAQRGRAAGSTHVYQGNIPADGGGGRAGGFGEVPWTGTPRIHPPRTAFQQPPLVEASGTVRGRGACSLQQGLRLGVRPPRPGPAAREAGVSVTDRLVWTHFA